MVQYLQPNTIIYGDSCHLLKFIEENSVACSVWSPPYNVGKNYELHLTEEKWKYLISNVIHQNFDIIKPGGFLAVNIADILCFKDENMPKLMADNVSRKKTDISKNEIIEIMEKYPNSNRYQIAKMLGCSEQTVDRRLNGNNIRGGKYAIQTRVKLVGGWLEEIALSAGFYLYDRRIWVKDPAWENSRWHSISYRSIDEFEYIYFFWKPGITKIDKNRLTKEEWIKWGSRAVWTIPSVRANNDHEAKFPIELPRRIIRLFTEPDDIVIDCFVGSGTTAVAAILEGRRYIGIDNQEKYVEMAKKACEVAVKSSNINLSE